MSFGLVWIEDCPWWFCLANMNPLFFPFRSSILSSHQNLELLAPQVCLFEDGALPSEDELSDPNVKSLFLLRGRGPVTGVSGIAKYCYKNEGYVSLSSGPTSFDELCDDFEKCFASDADVPWECSCKASRDGYEDEGTGEYDSLQCTNPQDSCLDGADGCATDFTAGHRYTPEGKYVDSFVNYSYDGETDVSSRLRYSGRGQAGENLCSLSVDGIECLRCLWGPCKKQDSTTVSHGFSADCSNLGYVGTISSCESDEGLFQYLSLDHMKCIRQTSQ